MPYYTVIANAEPPILLINQADNNSSRLLSEVLTGDPETRTVHRVQVATKELKERVKLFDKLGDRAYKAKQFFDKIPINNHFFFLPGRCDDGLQIFRFLKELASLDGTELNNPNMDRICDLLYENYTVKFLMGTKESI